ncbi:hypothetical protein DCC81_12540 [Chitinophaga parva]|uniref:3-oxoacyl-ACP synthase n=1 Tax=Chitinophaga parva TaxID=2169414 RepID=A0A2T7BFR7_9BACT|nr:hypothetical protein DCC81_12540 [Chitinophaga parva]
MRLDNASAYITATSAVRPQGVFRNGKLQWEHPAGDLQTLLRYGYEQLGSAYPKFHKMDALSKLGWLTAEVLLGANPLLERHAAPGVGLALANRSSSLDTDVRYYDTVKDIASPALFVYTLPNIVMGEICIRHGFKGENVFFVQDRFDTASLAGYVQELFNEKAVTACVCGWVEVMQDRFDAALYLVENQAGERAIPFTAVAMQHLYQTIANGNGETDSRSESTDH